jgi:cytosine/adenosine deaminase-related metal-dependent hydrolase
MIGGRLLLDRGYVVTMDADRRVFADGAVAIDDGRIVAVGDRADVLAGFPGLETIDAGGGLVLPGLIDSHHHPIFPALMSERRRMGRYPPVATNDVWSDGGDIAALMSWAAGPLGAPLSDEEAYVSALASLAMLLRSGVTCVIDGATAYANAVAQAALDLGVRCVVAQQCQDLVPDDAAPSLRRVQDADTLLAATEEAIDRWDGAGSGRIRVAASLFWPIGCSDELCRGMRQISDRRGVPVVTHVAALANEPEASRSYHGVTPFARLGNLGLLGPRLVCAHAGFPTDEEVVLLAREMVRIAHVPATSAFGVHGVISARAIPRYLAAGVVVGLGTDGTRPRATEYTLAAAASFHKDVSRDVSVLDAPTVLEMATIDGAIVAGWNDAIGSLQVGKRGDLIVVRRDGPEWQPDLEPVRAFVSGAGAGNVSTVVVDGRVLLRDGNIESVDEPWLRDRLASAADAVDRRAGDRVE